MNIVILGAAGFLGTNLILQLAKNKENRITAIDEKLSFFDKDIQNERIVLKEHPFKVDSDFNKLLGGQDIVYHLISTNNPTSSNINIGTDIAENLLITINILEACISSNVKKIIFISSGGTVYGDLDECPIKEDAQTNPINTYGIQKLTIEKIIYLYHKMHGLEYAIIRLANPYGPYQRPNGRLGVVTTFVYKALMGQPLTVYGDGSVIRDYIYIDDAINGILSIADSNHNGIVINLGSGKGTSINEVIETVKEVVDQPLKVEYLSGRAVDVPVNYLDVSKYNKLFDNSGFVSLKDGVKKTKKFLEKRLGFYE